jgi:hypothetical protein
MDLRAVKNTTELPRAGTCRQTRAAQKCNGKLRKSGAPGEIRTPDLLLRRQSEHSGPTKNQAVVVAPARCFAALSTPIAYILHTGPSQPTPAEVRRTSSRPDRSFRAVAPRNCLSEYLDHGRSRLSRRAASGASVRRAKANTISFVADLAYGYCFPTSGSETDCKEETWFLEHRDGLGVRLDSYRSTGARAYLYDLSQPATAPNSTGGSPSR